MAIEHVPHNILCSGWLFLYCKESSKACWLLFCNAAHVYVVEITCESQAIRKNWILAKMHYQLLYSCSVLLSIVQRPGILRQIKNISKTRYMLYNIKKT